MAHSTANDDEKEEEEEVVVVVGHSRAHGGEESRWGRRGSCRRLKLICEQRLSLACGRSGVLQVLERCKTGGNNSGMGTGDLVHPIRKNQRGQWLPDAGTFYLWACPWVLLVLVKMMVMR